ncbi:MAG: metalloregulator ArsR/SmtB family transcription factor [Bacteroidota bacterium]|nr:metalloregulator ArsR/SmtB family transcription factor [Bacteroidota bacterium]
MGITKNGSFLSTHNATANLFKALGHPARLAIIEHLLKVNSCICNDLVKELPLAQATISQHLRELKSVNLIQGEIGGNSICYCINPETMATLTECLELMNKKLKINNNCC